MMPIFDPIIVNTLMLVSPLAVVPQIIKATKDIKGLSLPYFSAQLLFQIYYTFYYFSINSIPLIINGVSAVTVIGTMVLIILIKRNK